MKIKNIKYCATLFLTTFSISLTGCSSPNIQREEQTTIETVFNEKEESVITELYRLNQEPYSEERKQMISDILNSQSDDWLIRLLDEEQLLEKITVTVLPEAGEKYEEKEVYSVHPATRIIGPNQTKEYSGYLMNTKIYRTSENGNTEYHFGYAKEEGIEDFKTGTILRIEEADVISLDLVLPLGNYEIRTEILENAEFQELLDKEFKKHEESILRQRELQDKKEKEELERKNILCTSILPLIENAMEEEKTDLEMIRIILNHIEDEKDLPIAMQIFTEIKEDALISCFDVITDPCDELMYMYKDGEFINHFSSSSVIYMTEDEKGLKYHLGNQMLMMSQDGEQVLQDVNGVETKLSECINQMTVPLSEIIPEVEKYRFSMDINYLNSKEFFNLMNGKIIESENTSLSNLSK